MVNKLKIQRSVLLATLTVSLGAHLVFGLHNIKEVQAYEYQIERQAAQLKDKQEQIEILEIIIENQEQDSSDSEYIGKFTVTHYCPCMKCCGKTDGITFTGTQATEGRTVAVDPEVIPLGSTVIIDGQEYVAEDIGGAIKGNRIDKFMMDHQEALRAGIVQADVWIGG